MSHIYCISFIKKQVPVAENECMNSSFKLNPYFTGAPRPSMSVPCAVGESAGGSRRSCEKESSH